MTGHDVEERLKVNDVLIFRSVRPNSTDPNAPSGEDTFIVTGLSELVAEKTGCTGRPAVAFGCTPFRISACPVRSLFRKDLHRNAGVHDGGILNAGFRKMILLNGHGHDL